jgi:hypothetical protein
VLRVTQRRSRHFLLYRLCRGFAPPALHANLARRDSLHKCTLRTSLVIGCGYAGAVSQWPSMAWEGCSYCPSTHFFGHAIMYGYQSTAPHADRREATTSRNQNLAGMDPYVAVSLETPRPQPSHTPAASHVLQNAPSRSPFPGASTQQPQESSGASSATKAFDNPRTSENLEKAASALTSGKVTFLNKAYESAKKITTNADTAMRFSIAKTYDVKDRLKKGLPRISEINRYHPISIGKFSKEDEKSRESIKNLVSGDGTIFENPDQKSHKSTTSYFGSLRTDNKYYQELFRE